MDVVSTVFELFDARGAETYFGEDVTQSAHALQTAARAVGEGAGDALVIAALLHDIGHLIHRRGEGVAARGIDARHEQLGANWLARHFGPEVTEPVRLHVIAKRYLCAHDRAYAEGLSAASQQSLQLQGGPLDPEAMRAFEQQPFAKDAVRLRRWDDEAKIVGLQVPTLDAYRDRLACPALRRGMDL